MRLLILLVIACLMMACSDSATEQSPPPKAPPAASKPTLFRLLSPTESGVSFANQLPETPQLNVLAYTYYYNGGGVAVGDVNNDKLPDLYFTGNLVQGKLYLNQGNLRFQDATEASGVICRDGWKTGVVMADVNADGHLDIYVCRSGKLLEDQRRNELFLNQGDGTFEEKAAEYGLDDPGYGTQAAFLDYDRDGDLDMYLLNHQIVPANLLGKSLPELRSQISPFAGDKLFRNEGTGKKFTDVSREAGILSNHIGYGLGIAVGDLNRDGWPDLYVSNDFMEPDYLYLNQQDGSFREVLKEQIGHTPFYSMGNDIADVNLDGWPDIVATDMMPADHFRQKTNMASMNPETFQRRVQEGFHYQYMFNTLQLNNGNSNYNINGNDNLNGGFSDIGKLAGISKTDWSWATLFADYDLDGWPDLFITNGMRKETWNNDFRMEKARRLQSGQPMPAVIRDLLPTLTSQSIPNFMFHNQGDLSFEKVSKEWGLNQGAYSNGAAYGDLDNDGDLDLVVNNIDGPAFVYQNQATNQHTNRHFLRVRLDGGQNNPFGIGAKVELQADGKLWAKENYLSRGYQSSVDPVLHFGLGGSNRISSLSVFWPDGRTQSLKDVQADQLLTLKIEDASKGPNKQNPQQDWLFSEETTRAGIDFRHRENAFDDFGREVLLPHKMSTLGPGIAVGDATGDGLEDFYIGGAKGQRGALFTQSSNGSFTRRPGPWEQDQGSEDIAASFLDADGDGDQDLYVVSGGNEVPADHPLMQDRLYQNLGKGQFSKWENVLPIMPSSGGCVAAQDFDQDGDMDLFVGGRQVPGRYPYPPQSYLLRNEGGSFQDVSQELAPGLKEIGMVSTAVWADLNGDGAADLILAGEWMPVKIFVQKAGQFVEETETWGLGETSGWWFSLAAADLDADGDMDLVGGNLGLNYKYKTSPDKPFQVFSGDFDSNGKNDIVLAYHEGPQIYPLRGRECSSVQMPGIQAKFPTYQSYGSASLIDVYGQQALQAALHLQVEEFGTCWWENEQGKLIRHRLPPLAQISSVHGILIDDWNGDSHPDLLIAGNLYDSEVETPRNDGGIGLFLPGDGAGNFQAIPARESGFLASGNVKALASIRTQQGQAILVSRNNDQLSLFLSRNKNF